MKSIEFLNIAFRLLGFYLFFNIMLQIWFLTNSYVFFEGSAYNYNAYDFGIFYEPSNLVYILLSAFIVFQLSIATFMVLYPAVCSLILNQSFDIVKDSNLANKNHSYLELLSNSIVVTCIAFLIYNNQNNLYSYMEYLISGKSQSVDLYSIFNANTASTFKNNIHFIIAPVLALLVMLNAKRITLMVYR